MSSQTDPVRVLHLTDPHLFADTTGVLRGAVTYATLSRVLEQYRHGGWPADLVAVTGDLIQDDSPDAYEHFKALLGSLDLPVHCLPGNHDNRTLMRSALDGPPFYYCDTIEIGNWLIVGIDSCQTGRAGGAIDVAEFDRLDAAIDSSDADHVMVCLHHPPVAMGSAWLDTVGLEDGPEFLARASASGKVRLAVFGHVHQDYDGMHEGIRIIATPSTCRQFKPGSEEFAVDDLPPAYRQISLHEDGNFDTELLWLDED
ncbi:MAG: phosphodiesterase [Woeseiaceae bacterium]